MTPKTKNIVSIAIGIIPSAMVVMSGIMKLTGNPMVVTGLTAGGFGPYIKVFGSMELLFVLMFFYPKTSKLGFLFLISYLGGAMSVEIGHGQPPMSAIFIALFWVSMFIKDRNMFLLQGNESKN